MRNVLCLRSTGFLALLAAMVLLAACGEEGPPEGLERVTFMAGFKPQANLPFVGAYVAQEKGFFTQQGLAVDIQHVSTAGENFKFLAAGQVQFSTADAAVVLERRASDPSLPIVALALIGQRGQQGFAVLADSGIASPKDWVGKTAGYKGTEPTPDFYAILEANDIPREQVRTVKVGFDPRVLTSGQVDIFPVFISNEPYLLRKLGYEVRLFEAADYGAPTLGLTYVTTERFIQEKPQVVERFLKAVLKGLEYARANPQEALDIVMGYAEQADRDHMQFMFETELAAALSDLTEANGMGWMTAQQWQDLHDFLVKYRGLPRALDDVSAAYNDEFLERVYRDGRLRWP